MTRHSLCRVLLYLLTTAVVPVVAQHETGSDIVSGERAFRDYCANCHGPDGDLIKGVDLGHNNFRQPYTDEDLAGIIMNGIPNTPMPATPRVTQEQAYMLVAYLRSRGDIVDTGLSGNPGRGKTLFDGRGECLDCHMVEGQGGILGPDLSSIALVRSSAELEDSLLNPNAVVQPNHRFYTVVTKSGDRISGRLLNHDAFSVQLLDENEKLRAFQKNDLANYGFSDPVMGSLAGEFSRQELADMVAYLATLRRGAAQ